MEIPTAPRERLLRLAALTAFFLSGFAALVYQVVWQRLLVVFSGADVFSSTLIVAAFMAGLGTGHLVGGVAADRSSRRQALLLFVAAELLIAAFSVVSRFLFYDLLYQRLGAYQLSAPVLTSVLFLSLLWPTFFMGVSLPLLARATTSHVDRAAGTVGALYAWNTLGAATGALVATWWILPAAGLDRTLRVAALLNISCAVLAMLPAWRQTDAPATSHIEGGRVGIEAGGAHVVPRGGSLPFSGWALVYALSGLVALSLEIVWFRLLGVMMKSTAFTFGTLLAVYLTGVGAGAVVGSLLAPRLRRPQLTFLLAQAAVGCSAAVLLMLILRRVDDIQGLAQYFGSYDPLSVREALAEWRSGRFPRRFAMLYVGLPAVLILPPTVLMGFSFPVLQRIVQTDFARLGRRVGGLMVANIAGSVVGTVATGWVALDLLGTAGTLKLLTILSLLFVVMAIFLSLRGRLRAVAMAGVVFLVLTLLRVLPDASTLWAILHGTTNARMVYGEDGSGLSVLRLEPGSLDGRTTVFVNGVGQSTIPYGDVHTGLGMVPAFLHPDPRDVAIIGLGSGDTVYGVAGRAGIERITCVEIIAPQIAGLRELGRRVGYGGLLGLLDDPRIRFVAGDGRVFLMHSPPQFDIIEADALRPSSAYSGNLYSVEYFELVRSRLRPQGLAATWLPTSRVHDAFVKVFPHVVSVPGILVGSNDPIRLDAAEIMQRLSNPRVREHYARAAIDAQELMSFYLASPAVYTPEFDRSNLTDVNTDLFPKDEYDLSPP